MPMETHRWTGRPDELLLGTFYPGISNALYITLKYGDGSSRTQRHPLSADNDFFTFSHPIGVEAIFKVSIEERTIYTTTTFKGHLSSLNRERGLNMPISTKTKALIITLEKLDVLPEKDVPHVEL